MHIFALTFTPNIDLGTLISVAAIIATFYRFHISNVRKIDKMEWRINVMWNHLKKRLSIDDSHEDLFSDEDKA
jgi:hypothetical protein